MNAAIYRSASAALIAWLTLAQAPLWASPPGHAPAHGWRKQHDPYYLGYTGKKWDKDYGITAGRCDREAVATVLGGAVGGAVSAQTGQAEDKRVAIIVGAAEGAVIGAKIGRDIGATDAACIGHALELARDGRRVSWRDKAGTRFLLRPLTGFSQNGLPCRNFELGGGGKPVRQSACQQERGVWVMQ